MKRFGLLNFLWSFVLFQSFVVEDGAGGDGGDGDIGDIDIGEDGADDNGAGEENTNTETKPDDKKELAHLRQQVEELKNDKELREANNARDEAIW